VKKPMPEKRADYGSAADPYFDRQIEPQKGLLLSLRALVRDSVHDARESIKWGMPFYMIRKPVCALAAFKSHVSINFLAPIEILQDPDNKLEGSGKGMRHFKVRAPEDIDEELIKGWLSRAAAYARR
jgi:hypothetical protein